MEDLPEIDTKVIKCSSVKPFELKNSDIFDDGKSELRKEKFVLEAQSCLMNNPASNSDYLGFVYKYTDLDKVFFKTLKHEVDQEEIEEMRHNLREKFELYKQIKSEIGTSL